ncbi:MAG: site-2 protease family protein [Phycisphaerales bacterium]
MFVRGDNPMDWSITLFKIAGIRVRAHMLFVLYVVFEVVAAALQQGQLGPGYRALSIGALFTLVLLHEFGHCLVCRWVGGTADDILLWPLGGLAFCRPPHRWKASLATTLGGPAVNAVLVPVLGALVLSTGTGWDGLIFNLFKYEATLVQLNLTSWWAVGVWSLYYVNLALLAFNMLVPMFPMDAGRVVQELLWARVGYAKSMWISTTVGLAGAAVLAVLGMTTNQTTLIMIAIFGGLTCYSERQKLRYLRWQEEEESPWAASAQARWRPDADARAGTPPEVPEDFDPDAAARKARAALEAEQTEVDRILAKIARAGMASLSRAEKATLEGASARKRRG